MSSQRIKNVRRVRTGSEQIDRVARLFRQSPMIRKPTKLLVKHLGLYPLFSKIRTSYDSRFKTLTPDTPPAIDVCFDELVRCGKASGDYLEFGVYRGFTLWRAIRAAQSRGFGSMRFFGFDSFEGLPQPIEIDQDGGFKKGSYACPLTEVERNLTKRKVDWNRTFLIDGFYDGTLNADTKRRYDIRESALVLIDCDLYASARSVLRFLEDVVREGTILMFDDWNCFSQDPNKGERKAFREFLEENPHIWAEEFVSFGWHGQSFTLHEH